MSSTQHFTLLISGMQDIYPILQRDGTFTAEATRKGVALKFHVGVSPSTKPSQSQAQIAIRSFRLLDEERIDSPQPEIEDGWSMEPVAPVIEEPPEPGSFKRFALSHSLEALLEQQFLSVLRLRIQFKIGWAGAELMHHHIQKVQVAPDVVFAHLQRVSALKSSGPLTN
jgi:ubiquitin-conjugating enzyme E2 Q